MGAGVTAHETAALSALSRRIKRGFLLVGPSPSVSVHAGTGAWSTTHLTTVVFRIFQTEEGVDGHEIAGLSGRGGGFGCVVVEGCSQGRARRDGWWISAEIIETIEATRGLKLPAPAAAGAPHHQVTALNTPRVGRAGRRLRRDLVRVEVLRDPSGRPRWALTLFKPLDGWLNLPDGIINDERVAAVVGKAAASGCACRDHHRRRAG